MRRRGTEVALNLSDLELSWWALPVALLLVAATGAAVVWLRRGDHPRVGPAMVALTAVALGIQFIRPDPPTAVLPSDGEISDHVDVPADVERILRNACSDCHSAETRWPWYSRVAPVSWWIAQDVQHGRSNLDFSAWSRDPHREPTPRQRLTWMCRDVRSGTMPPLAYTIVHPEARLTPREQDRLCAWTRDAVRSLEDRTPEPAT